MRVIIVILFLFSTPTLAKKGVRVVNQTSCDVIKVNLGLGMTTQLVLEQEPQVTLYADKTHFKVNTNKQSPRSLAIIPFVSSSEIDVFRDASGALPNQRTLAQALNKSFKTNLFVFFENSNQLMFELRFVEKEKADYILKVKQNFTKSCAL